MYTVKQLSDLAGVTIRTLHHYDEIALLKPSRLGDNGYRYYDDDALFRLQQILFYREIGLELAQIKDVLDSPDFDLVTALRSHRKLLQDKAHRLKKLIETVDSTMMHLAGEMDMSRKRLFEAFTDEQQKDYERLARLEYGPTTVNESIRRWNSYTKAQQEAIRDEGNQVYAEMVDALEAGLPAHDPKVQALLVRWHNHIHYFYEPTLDTLRGLGDLYNTSRDFIANFQKQHPDLPAYLQQAITQYVDDLETAELERMIAEDEARNNGR
jgi:DNA-binding transcriptional MerR regulator